MYGSQFMASTCNTHFKCIYTVQYIMYSNTVHTRTRMYKKAALERLLSKGCFRKDAFERMLSKECRGAVLYVIFTNNKLFSITYFEKPRNTI